MKAVDCLVITIILFVFSIYYVTTHTVKYHRLKNNYEDTQVRVKEFGVRVQKQDRAVGVLLKQLQNVRTLQDLDTILSRLKIKRGAALVKE